MQSLIRLCTCLGWLTITPMIALAEPNTPVDFVRDIQPIFREHCYRCHGPTKAEAELRLSRKTDTLKTGVISPGEPETSELLSRLADPDAGDLMPLDGKQLSTDQIAIIRRWIQQGAVWPESADQDQHWAYVAPKRPELPASPNQERIVTPIDAFIQATLDREGFKPSPPTERAKLLRRVSLVLTGLPPTPQQYDAFLKDTSPDAYEKVVDALLKSPRFGEHWARHWLDLARYADSNGYQADQLRDSWAYRDWVIRAFNQEMPFDQFVIEQLAGDLLPNATLDQKIATGLHRATTCNVEAGVHPEENRVNQVFDRVNTTGTIFLGTTLECAQCHDHKYDPFTQKEYYQLFAYFNNTPLEVVQNSGVQFEFTGPTMNLPMPPDQRQQHDQLTQQITQAEAKLKQARAQLPDFDTWQEQTRAALDRETPWEVMPIRDFDSTGGEDATELNDGSILIGGRLPGTSVYTVRYPGPLGPIHGFKIEALTHPDLPGKGPGRGDDARPNFILSEFDVQIATGKQTNPVRLHTPRADFSQPNWPVAAAIDGDRSTGWAIGQEFHQPHWATFRTRGPVSLKKDEALVLSFDQNFGRGRTIGRLRLSALIGEEPPLDVPDDLIPILRKPADKRTKAEQKQLIDHHATSSPETRRLSAEITRLRRELNQIPKPTTLIMVEMDQSRTTHRFDRGDYLNPSETVEPGTPATLHPLNSEWPRNRLGLARWLTSPQNPLVARVTVNRWWGEVFGTGIVGTPEDFGTQSEPPVHPELLDWLAVEFVESGWSMKHVLKEMVMSATFRQSSAVTPELQARDPGNRYLARGPRYRLSAEAVRDNALSVSGMLSETMGGSPVMPYQPDGLWRAVGRNAPKWVTASNEDRFRRGVYVVWRRAAPYPSFVNFDAPDRAACVVSRPRTNTPLQALTLLNDPAYAELAVAFAVRMMRDGGATARDRVKFGFRLCVGRDPSEREMTILENVYQQEVAAMRMDPSLARARIVNLPAKWRPDTDDEIETAAWFAVANVLLNLDETISVN